VVDALDIVLDQSSRQAMLDVGVRDVDAFVAYQRGYRTYIDAHGRDDMLERLAAAEQYFDHAIAAAPDFAEAYADKTDYYAHIVLDSDHTDEQRQAALQTLLDLDGKAMELARDPQRRRLVDIDRTFFTEDWSRLPKLLKDAFETDSCADGNWMELADPFGMEQGMAVYYQRQVRCDPLMLLNYGALAGLQARQGDLDGAHQTLSAGRRAGGEHRWLQGQQGNLKLMTGQAEQALAELRSSVGSPPSVQELHQEIRILAALGRTDEARALLAEMKAREPLRLRTTILISAYLGDRAEANAAATALDARPGGPVELVRAINYCSCGAPFDLDATPMLRDRIAEAGFPWPPVTDIKFPAKDW
jgi:tetratricopeptide (TPR) repeat protein